MDPRESPVRVKYSRFCIDRLMDVCSSVRRRCPSDGADSSADEQLQSICDTGRTGPNDLSSVYKHMHKSPAELYTALGVRSGRLMCTDAFLNLQQKIRHLSHRLPHAIRLPAPRRLPRSLSSSPLGSISRLHCPDYQLRPANKAPLVFTSNVPIPHVYFQDELFGLLRTLRCYRCVVGCWWWPLL